MAFNWQTFKTRTLTAAVFVVVMLAGLLWNHWSFFILFSVIHFGCWWEYLKLIEKIHQLKCHPYFKFGVMLMGYGLMLLFAKSSFQLNGYSIKENFSLPISVAGFALLLIGILQKTKITISTAFGALAGLFYVSVSWGLMMNLYAYSNSDLRDHSTDIFFHDSRFAGPGYFFPLIIIVSIWVNDTMAYIVGSIIGKTSLSKISPKKTWEGTIGGVVLSGVVIFLLSKSFISDYLSLILMTIAIIASIAGTFGDLFESKLKRLAGVKDSGHIMPGHGGFLDRFDSLLFAVPFVWVYVYFFLE
jgi:phosphatidate cytidylyltransferase